MHCGSPAGPWNSKLQLQRSAQTGPINPRTGLLPKSPNHRMPELLALELGDESFTLRPPTTTLRTDVLLKLRFRITGHLVLPPGSRGGIIKTVEGQSVAVSCSGGGGACPGPCCLPEILINCGRGDCAVSDPPINASNGAVLTSAHVLLPPSGSPAPAPGPPNPKNNHL